jgi:hypothetical protein
MDRFANAQVRLNNLAAEKYAKNPIIDRVIQQMMEHQTNALAGQFNQPGANAQREMELKERTAAADIRYKDSLSRQANATAKKAGEQYTSTDAVMRDKGPAGAARFFANDVNGQELLKGTEWPSFVQQMEQLETTRFIKKNKWGPDQVATNQEAIQAHIASVAPRLRQRATYKWMESEYGKDAAEAAGTERPGLLADPAAEMEYDVKVMPSKKDMKEKKTKWAALGLEAANQELRKDRNLTKPQVEKWLVDEWLPAAMKGEDVNGNYFEETAGLTADASNKTVGPYLEAVLTSLTQAFKWIGTGKDTDQLLESQKPRRRSPRGGLSRAAKGIFSDEVYAPDFRKEFPQQDKKE